MSRVRKVFVLFLLALTLAGTGQGGLLNDFQAAIMGNISVADDAAPGDDAPDVLLSGLDTSSLEQRVAIPSPLFSEPWEVLVADVHSPVSRPDFRPFAARQSLLASRTGLLPRAPSPV